jgi:hypothetical protein
MSEGSSFFRPRQRLDLDLQRMDARNYRHWQRHQFCLICKEKIVGKYWFIKEGFARGEAYACTRCASQVAVVQRTP